MKSRVLIVTGGEVDITTSIEYIKDKKYDKIVVADGGLKYVEDLKIRPDIILGDFDTVSPELLHQYEIKGFKVVRLNPMKDDTDTEAAFLEAIKDEPDEIDILGAVGSRFDHSFANMFLLKRGYELGVKVYIITELNKIHIISGNTEFKKNELYGEYVSLIQFDGSAKGIFLEGFAYPLTDFDFDTSKTYRLGVSNEVIEETAVVRVREGYLLVVESKEDANKVTYDKKTT